MATDTQATERLDPKTIETLRAMKPWQKIAAMLNCNRVMRLRLAGHLKTRHPDWTAEQIEAEIARRFSRGSG